MFVMQFFCMKRNEPQALTQNKEKGKGLCYDFFRFFFRFSLQTQTQPDKILETKNPSGGDPKHHPL